MYSSGSRTRRGAITKAGPQAVRTALTEAAWAYRSRPRITYTALASGGNRLSTLSYTHDGYGRVTTVSSVPDTTDASQDTCTTTTYAANTSEWLLDLPAQVQVVSVPCGTTPVLPADAVSDTLTLYDGSTYDASDWPGSDTPTDGDVTETDLATSYTSGSSPAPVYTMQSKASYDQYGRVLF